MACLKSKSKRLAKMEENIQESKAVGGSILAEEVSYCEQSGSENAPMS
jgi:hypothetical protein